MSRKKAKQNISLDDFVQDMANVNTFSVSEDTIDESSFAYKDYMQVITDSYDTMEVIEIKKPIFNFKGQ